MHKLKIVMLSTCMIHLYSSVKHIFEVTLIRSVNKLHVLTAVQLFIVYFEASVVVFVLALAS